ncbi:hypothetical protein niasHT_012888 [Heterodera trifolii]|uniref:PPPDE domain-containing protein n=1 Tax=Heterodera trifolii TaxID=157864 RepID=A0ABD2KZH8_9BILA
MPLIIIGFSIICAHFGQILSNPDGNDADGRLLSFNQIGEFIEAVKEPIFKEIITFGRPIDDDTEEGEEADWIDNLDNKMNHISVRLGAIQLFRSINSRINAVQQKIVDCVSKKCANQPENCQEMVKVAKAQLSVRLLISMAKRIVQEKILDPIHNKPLQKVKLCKWWYRFRYSVAGSAIQFVDTGSSSEIRIGILQYYLDTQSELKALIAQFDSKHAYLATVLSTLDRNSAFLNFQMRTTDAEQAEFIPSNELAEEKLTALMRKPEENEVQVELFTVKFPIPFKLGSCLQACDIDHRGVKIYDIVFHFGGQEGILIADKIRIRSGDSAKGIKFHRIGYTKKSQWEVQKIFDHFNDFYMENEQLKEGTFSSRTYNLLKNNCINFSKEFVEALLEGDKQLKV